jgi:hypothetical protein
MTRHISRRQRWQKLGPAEYRCGGAVVRPFRGGWYAWVSYRLPDPQTPPGRPPAWQARQDRLGPYRRPRNAMIAAEQHVLQLSRLRLPAEFPDRAESTPEG